MAQAQTLQQWHDKIKKWVPSWWFENKYNMSVAVTDAVFYAAAAVYQRAEQDMLDQQSATFILKSPAPTIDLLGDERSLSRLAGESDAAYEVRVQNSLFRNVSQSVIQPLVDAQLNNGSSLEVENVSFGFYDDADITATPGIPYFDDQYTRYLNLRKTYNWFTVFIPRQTGGDLPTIFKNVIAQIEANKALGSTYDVYVDTAQGLTDESGNQLTDENGNPLFTQF